MRSHLGRLLRRAEKDRKPAISSDYDVEGWFDIQNHLYFLIQRGAYSASNLLLNLFDILVEHPMGEEEVLEAEAFDAIDRYIGMIELKETISFQGQRENLRQITREMIHILSLVEEEDFSGMELEKVSQEIDKSCYEPIAMILQGILIEIEKAPQA